MAPTVLITGASRGIGLATTHAILSDGARVVALYRTLTPGLQDLKTQYDESLRLFHGDVTDEAVIKRALQQVLDAWGGLDTLVLNAGINLPIGRLEQVPMAGWQAMFDVNVFAVIRFLREAIPALRKSNCARVILLSSEAATAGIPGAAMYCASKAALNSLNRCVPRAVGTSSMTPFNSTLAVDEPTIISVAVDPGRVNTDVRCIHLVYSTLIPEHALDDIRATTIQPEMSGRAVATLAMRASKDLSGKFIRWDDPAVAAL